MVKHEADGTSATVASRGRWFSQSPHPDGPDAPKGRRGPTYERGGPSPRRFLVGPGAPKGHRGPTLRRDFKVRALDDTIGLIHFNSTTMEFVFTGEEYIS